jgi:hypothetical protein
MRAQDAFGAICSVGMRSTTPDGCHRWQRRALTCKLVAVGADPVGTPCSIPCVLCFNYWIPADIYVHLLSWFRFFPIESHDGFDKMI